MNARRNAILVLNDTFRGYRRYVLILTALGMAGAALDGIGINAIIPLASFLLGHNGVPTDTISQMLAHVFAFFGVPFKFRYLLMFVGVVFLLRGFLLAAFTYLRGTISAGYMAKEINILFHWTLSASWLYMAKQKAGFIQNTVFWDARRNTQLLDSIVQFIQSSTGALIYLLVAVNISATITLSTIVAGGCLLLLFRPLVARSRLFGDETAIAEKLLVQHIGEHLQGFKLIKASGVTDKAVQAARRYIARLEHAYSRLVFVQGLSNAFFQPLSFLFIIGVFAFSYKSGGFNLAAFAATMYLIQKIFVYMESLQNSFHTISQFIPFAENVTQYKKEIQTNKEPDVARGNMFAFEKKIELRDVSLSYVDGTSALSHLSGEIVKGSMLGIVGPSGGGKTSVADLLLRLFQPTSGELLADDVPAETIQLKDWRRHVAYVSQESFLLNDTVRNNIRFYDEKVTEDDIVLAAKQAHIFMDIQKLPHGFDTEVGDRGVSLSGGQRQRVALARALARKPMVLVLDEVTSSLDSDLERQIQVVIDELRGEMTLVIIAHRVSTVLKADQIWVLEKGTIASRGTPTAMLENSDSYLSRMIQMQGSNTSGGPAA